MNYAVLFLLTVRPAKDREIILWFFSTIESVGSSSANEIAEQMRAAFYLTSVSGDEEWFLKEYPYERIKEELFFSAINLEDCSDATEKIGVLLLAVAHEIRARIPKRI